MSLQFDDVAFLGDKENPVIVIISKNKTQADHLYGTLLSPIYTLYINDTSQENCYNFIITNTHSNNSFRIIKRLNEDEIRIMNNGSLKLSIGYLNDKILEITKPINSLKIARI